MELIKVINHVAVYYLQNWNLMPSKYNFFRNVLLKTQASENYFTFHISRMFKFVGLFQTSFTGAACYQLFAIINYIAWNSTHGLFLNKQKNVP